MIKIINNVSKVQFDDLENGDLFTFDFMADDTYSLPPIWMKTNTINGNGGRIIVSMTGDVDYVTTPEIEVYPMYAELAVKFGKE